MFIDKARIFVTAGRGGSGCVTFRREKYEPMGGPNGGNGGKGGDVYLVADPHFKTLLDLAYRPHYSAQDGGAGGNSNKTGRSSEDLIIRVPPGTVVFRGGELLADLNEPGRQVVVARGGRGGRGNAAFKTSRHTAPRIAEKGEPGENVTLDLELRLIADVGLVGFPNAGKSTFLSRISSARPKIADYPFTTLTPNLGVVTLGDQSFVVADIPGLIEGAHAGKGLGDEFLRHVKRTKVLVHLVDISGFSGKSAYEAYLVVNRELEQYSDHVAHKPMLVAANKMDLTGSDELYSAFKKKTKRTRVFPISAATGHGVKELLSAVVKLLSTVPAEAEVMEPVAVKKYVYEPEFAVEIEDDVYVIKGTKIEKLAAMTDFGQEEALQRFHNILKKMGVEKALEDRGVKPGDLVRIGEQEFTYER